MKKEDQNIKLDTSSDKAKCILNRLEKRKGTKMELRLEAMDLIFLNEIAKGDKTKPNRKQIKSFLQVSKIIEAIENDINDLKAENDWVGGIQILFRDRIKAIESKLNKKSKFKKWINSFGYKNNMVHQPNKDRTTTPPIISKREVTYKSGLKQISDYPCLALPPPKKEYTSLFKILVNAEKFSDKDKKIEIEHLNILINAAKRYIETDIKDSKPEPPPLRTVKAKTETGIIGDAKYKIQNKNNIIQIEAKAMDFNKCSQIRRLAERDKKWKGYRVEQMEYGLSGLTLIHIKK